MKAISEMMWIIVVVVVVIVAALVVLTIFAGGVRQVASISEAKSICAQWCASSCVATGHQPSNWNAKSFRIDSILKACSESDVAGVCTCTST